jgi:hypothetical protein
VIKPETESTSRECALEWEDGKGVHLAAGNIKRKATNWKTKDGSTALNFFFV